MQSFLLKLFLINSTLMLLLTFSLNAEDKTVLFSADKTVQKSQRKTVMGISRLGVESKNYSFSVFFTPAYKGAKPLYVGNWSVKLSQEYADSILAQNYPFLISNRYDKLLFNNKETKILTPTQEIAIKSELLSSFNPSVISYKNYTTQLSEYLNENIAKKIEPILSEAAEVRYSQMSSKESETFITTKAKEIGMSALVLESLLNSAYAFSIYMPKVSGVIYINQNMYQDSYGRVYYDYTTTISAPLTLNLTLYKYSDKRFSISTQLSSEAGNGTNFLATVFEGIAKGVSGSSSITTTYRPRKKHAQKIFEEAFEHSFKDNIVALSTRLKENRDFAISSPLKSVEGKYSKIAVGVQEDIRVDHPFKVIRTIDEEEQIVGYLKVYKSAKNCLSLAKERRGESEAYAVIGEVEEADLAVEYPWSGVFGSLSLKQNAGTFKHSELSETNTGATTLLNLGMSADLGYVLNSPTMSEVWMSLDLGLGGAEYTTLPSYNEFTPDGSDALALEVNLAIEKRYNLSHSLYSSLGVGVNYESQSYSYESFSEDGSLSLATLSINPEIKLGYMFSPSMDFYTAIGYNLPLSTSHSFTYGDDDTELALYDSYEKNAAIGLRFGLNIHLNFAGIFTGMFAKPSCSQLKYTKGKK